MAERGGEQGVDRIAKQVYPIDMARVAQGERMVTVAAKVPPAVAEALQRLATRDERTLSQIMLRIVRAELERLGELPGGSVESVASGSPKNTKPAG